MLAEGLDEGRGFRSFEGILEDGRVAEQDVKFDEHQFTHGHLPGAVGSEAKKGRASAYSGQSQLSE